MLPSPAGREASLDVGALVYERQRPEQTLLYQIIDKHFPDFPLGDGSAGPAPARLCTG